MLPKLVRDGKFQKCFRNNDYFLMGGRKLSWIVMEHQMPKSTPGRASKPTQMTYMIPFISSKHCFRIKEPKTWIKKKDSQVGFDL